MQADDPISFLQLSTLRSAELGGAENVFELSLTQAVAGGVSGGPPPLLSTKLSKVTQLTGFSDPVYAEAYVHVNQYDIVLDVLIVNQTGEPCLITTSLVNLTLPSSHKNSLFTPKL